METGLQVHWSEAIRAWAEQQPLVLETHAFGSRVKGGYTTDSDLDLALMVDGQDEGEQLGNAICLLPVWRAELQELLPVKVHAQSMTVDDIVVWPAVKQHGLLIYCRAAPSAAVRPPPETDRRQP